MLKSLLLLLLRQFTKPLWVGHPVTARITVTKTRPKGAGLIVSCTTDCVDRVTKETTISGEAVVMLVGDGSNSSASGSS